MEANEMRDFLNLQDRMEDTAAKIAFLRDFFNHSISEQEFFSKRGIYGVHNVLRDIENEIDLVIKELTIIGRRIDDSKKS